MTAPDPAATEAALHTYRPDLVPVFRQALPGAQAAVLARLWGAYAREPLPGLVGRHTEGGRLVCALAGGHTLAGPEAASRPFADPATLALTLDGVPYADPATLFSALAGPDHPFAVELANSVANLALARAAQPAPDPTIPLTATLLEQSVVDGHPLHPGCRTRLGMSTLDVLRYGPEHRPVVPLALVAVPEDRFLHTGQWPDRLRADGRILLPVHPWQAEYVLPAYPDLRPTGASLTAEPLMSLRSLATVDGAWQLKTAVDVQMTSAVRIVSPAAVRNGPVLSAFLADLAVRVGGLALVPETAAGAVLVDGEPSRSLAVVIRRPPDQLAVPAAALAAPSPATGRTLAADLAGAAPHEFLAQLVRVLVPPLQALLDLGVALEAHGQNTLVVFHSGRPESLLYRDLGGIRVSPARLRSHGIDPPPVYGDLVDDDPAVLRCKVLAGALSTVVAQVVTALAAAYGEEPDALWRTVAPALRRLSLGTGPWPIKATTAMRLAIDPLDDLWTDLPNPLEAL